MVKNLLDLKGIGEKGLIKLNRIGIRTIEDLLFHLPIRYQDRTKITNISETIPGKMYFIEGIIEKTSVIFYKKRMHIVRISDGTETMQLRFFYFNKNQIKNFEIGASIRCYGDVRNINNIKEIIHPEYQFFDKKYPPELDDYFTPVYPLTDGLHQSSLRNFIKQSLALLKSKEILFPEILSKEILKKYNLVDINSAIYNIHMPNKKISYESLVNSENKNKKRLVFEELLAHQLVFKRIRVFNKTLSSFKLNDNDKGLINVAIHNRSVDMLLKFINSKITTVSLYNF